VEGLAMEYLIAPPPIYSLPSVVPQLRTTDHSPVHTSTLQWALTGIMASRVSCVVGSTIGSTLLEIVNTKISDSVSMQMSLW